MFLDTLNETEKISKASNIANALVNVMQGTISPQDIGLAVNIVSTLNKYDHFSCF